MRQPKRCSGLRRLVLSVLFAVVACSTACASGSARIDTLPHCPAWTDAGLDSFERLLELDDPALAGVVRYLEDITHYCGRVLPAWQGGDRSWF